MLSSIMENLENQDAAILMYPVNSQSLSRVQKGLKDEGFPLIPKEYLDFLHLTNGLIYDETFFYGTEEIEEERLVGILEANRDFFSGDKEHNILVIGTHNGDTLIYNSIKDIYEILDRNSGETIEEFETLLDMVSEFCDDDSYFYDEELDELDDLGFEDEDDED